MQSDFQHLASNSCHFCLPSGPHSPPIARIRATLAPLTGSRDSFSNWQNIQVRDNGPSKNAMEPFSIRFRFALGPFRSFRFVSNHLFQNVASCPYGKHGFARRHSTFCIKQMQFWTPKWPQQCCCCHRWSLLTALGPFGKPFLPLLSHPGICKIRWENVFFFV